MIGDVITRMLDNESRNNDEGISMDQFEKIWNFLLKTSICEFVCSCCLVSISNIIKLNFKVVEILSSSFFFLNHSRHRYTGKIFKFHNHSSIGSELLPVPLLFLSHTSK